MRPLVGITLGDGDEPGLHALREDYLRSVEQAGAIPLALPPVEPADAPAILDRLDGVVLSGGVDVDPALYGQVPHPKLGRVNRRRDDFELTLTREALRRDVPLLAICRGHQVLNVATGGTLLQDIPSTLGGRMEHQVKGPRFQYAHTVDLARTSLLRAILGRDSLPVNSLHHQAVGRPGDGLVVSARCPEDGVVEGLEMPGRRFVVGVQWHPESFWDRPDPSQALFAAHVDACRAAALARTPSSGLRAVAGARP
jgi:putative glutamine amidotransferase